MHNVSWWKQFIRMGMSGYLPYGGFKCLKNVDKFDVNSISENSLMVYLFEVDLKYPDELEKLHNDIH